LLNSNDDRSCGFDIYAKDRVFQFTTENEGEKKIWLEEIELALFAILRDKNHYEKSDALLPEIILGSIHSAAHHGDLELLQQHISRLKTLDKDVDIFDDAGMTPIHYACLKGSIQCVNALLDAGSSIDCLNSGLNSPLLLASSRGHEDIVSELIHLGADVSIRNLKDRDALFMAVVYAPNSIGLEGVIRMLKKQGVEDSLIQPYSGH
jgi:hypothetical protein